MGDLISTNENCIGCNRCVGACSCLGANVSVLENGKSRIDELAQEYFYKYLDVSETAA